jgi:hypothetical protein
LVGVGAAEADGLGKEGAAVPAGFCGGDAGIEAGDFGDEAALDVREAPVMAAAGDVGGICFVHQRQRVKRTAAARARAKRVPATQSRTAPSTAAKMRRAVAKRARTGMRCGMWGMVC